MRTDDACRALYELGGEATFRALADKLRVCNSTGAALVAKLRLAGFVSQTIRRPTLTPAGRRHAQQLKRAK